MSASRAMVTPLFVALLLSLSAAPGARAGIADHPMILLHIDAPTGKNPCAPRPLRLQDVVTAAPSDPSGGRGYFVYVLVRAQLAELGGVVLLRAGGAPAAPGA